MDSDSKLGITLARLNDDGGVFIPIRGLGIDPVAGGLGFEERGKAGLATAAIVLMKLTRCSRS